MGATLALVITGVAALANPASASAPRAAAASSHCSKVLNNPRLGNIRGITRPMVTSCTKSPIGKGDPAIGDPPLLYHGGTVMSTPAVGSQVVVTPIYWAPPGYDFTDTYKNLINQYLGDVSAASGRTDNVFSTNTEYGGTNGQVVYGMSLGTPIIDNSALPANECRIDDTSGGVYGDGTGYSACLDDDQIIAETQNVITANSLPTDLGHMYVMFTPKHVESCFYSDAEVGGNPDNNFCTINSTPSAAYCAYHSAFGSTAESIYAEMPFPIYNSSIGFSCTDEGLGGGIQHPNGDPDADVEISPLSHEISEAITDPNTNPVDGTSGWWDASGYENGDECAYVYGALQGAAGTYYNQVISGHTYLTQEEFSNQDFATTGGLGGCLQGAPGALAKTPKVTKSYPKSGSRYGGTKVTVIGKHFVAGAKVLFGHVKGTHVHVKSAHKIKVRTPAHSKGKVHVYVRTTGGKSHKTSRATFRFK